MNRRRRLSLNEIALRHRVVRFCRRNRFRVIAMHYAVVLVLFRRQARLERTARWTAHL